MANTKLKYFILTGDPGVGKTTLIKKLIAIVNEAGFSTRGFYTEEVRTNIVRDGFDVVTLDNKRGRLARDMKLLESPVEFKVGKYGVLIEEFENVALPSLKQGSKQLLVIDEIGKMEFFSERFKAKIEEIFNPTTSYFVLATIPIRKSDPLIKYIRKNPYAKVWLVTRENRNSIHEEILRDMKVVLKF